MRCIENLQMNKNRSSGSLTFPSPRSSVWWPALSCDQRALPQRERVGLVAGADSVRSWEVAGSIPAAAGASIIGLKRLLAR